MCLSFPICFVCVCLFSAWVCVCVCVEICVVFLCLYILVCVHCYPPPHTNRSASGLRQHGPSSGEGAQPLAPDPPSHGGGLRAPYPSPARSLQPPPATHVLQRTGLAPQQRVAVHTPGYPPNLPRPNVRFQGLLRLPPSTGGHRRPQRCPAAGPQTRIR